MRIIKAMLVALALVAVSLTGGVNESFAGVPTAAAIAPAVTAVGDGAVDQVYWRRGWGWGGGGGWGWRRPGWGWRRPGWGGGYGWGGGGYGWGGGGGCWRWRATPWGPRRVWVC
jgi:hypothetical protein